MNRPFVPYRLRHGHIDQASECAPSFTLEAHISSLRDVDPVKWERLQSEWRQS